MLDITEIKKECQCNSLLTINLFPHTYNIAKDISSKIGNLLIRSNQLYSHTIFFEYVDSEISDSISTLECSFYWLDIEKTQFISNLPRKFTLKVNNKKKTLLPINSKYSIFSNLSLNFKLNHEYSRIPCDFCPGIPHDKLFNEDLNVLFFDRPFEQDSSIDNIVDCSTIVLSEPSLNGSQIHYTQLDTIKKFPQNSITRGLDKYEVWANELYNFYLNSAKNGNTPCYNNLAVVQFLRRYNGLNDDIQNFNAKQNCDIVDLLQRAIDKNDIFAMINFASLLLVSGKEDEAFIYYNLAYKNGSPEGAYSVGVAYHFGKCGVKQNYEKAIECYRNSVDFYNKKADCNKICSENHIQTCCLNLILLMYQEGNTLYEISKEYNKVKNPTEKLTYAYTMISYNLCRIEDTLIDAITQIWDKWNSQTEKESSFMKYNKAIVAYYIGCNRDKCKMPSSPEKAYDDLLTLANSSCKDWPEWEKYIWNQLALWSKELQKTPTLVGAYWIKVFKANPDSDIECAFRTNMALDAPLTENEKKSIWKKFAFGNGCKTCHECSNYDSKSRCCPKAQLRWARDYEKDKSISSYIMGLAVNQGYVPAIYEVAINQVYKDFDSNITIDSTEDLAFIQGVVPDALLKCIDNFNTPKNYNLLCRVAHQGGKKAATLLAKLTENWSTPYEHYYWKFATSQPYIKKLALLSKLANRTLSDGYFEAKNILEIDFINFANEIVKKFGESKEQPFKYIDILFGGSKELALKHINSLAEFYSNGSFYDKALNLYKIAEEKGFDVTEKITYIEHQIKKQDEEEKKFVEYNPNSNYYDYC